MKNNVSKEQILWQPSQIYYFSSLKMKENLKCNIYFFYNLKNVIYIIFNSYIKYIKHIFFYLDLLIFPIILPFCKYTE